MLAILRRFMDEIEAPFVQNHPNAAFQVVLAVVGAVALALARMVVAPAPAHSMGRASHALSRRHVRFDAASSVGSLDRGCVVFVVRAEAQRIRNEAAKQSASPPRIRFCSERPGERGDQQGRACHLALTKIG